MGRRCCGALRTPRLAEANLPEASHPAAEVGCASLEGQLAGARAQAVAPPSLRLSHESR